VEAAEMDNLGKITKVEDTDVKEIAKMDDTNIEGAANDENNSDDFSEGPSSQNVYRIGRLC
jgi:hypothetical protein